ncbi:4-hydroxy-tetrahydrodipicolinate reductase [Thermoanaerobacterium sp. DL9XJH110]|uniref:4-hydroxy-tetrahydrodipicolinate reductase n=1 Tax=Thermoanaerobacterium sp. DL9XJH110 TaxID=3386643 RepID=UPI003BB77EFC
MVAGKIKVIVTGAAGRVGREISSAILEQEDMELVGAVDVAGTGQDLGELVGKKQTGIIVEKDLEQVIKRTDAEVMVDFTNSQAALENARVAVFNGVRPVIGTTGLAPSDIEKLRAWCEQNRTGAFLAPNFAIGAVLMMLMARMAARYFPDVEIIELHHDGKLDAPSGTSLMTAELINRERGHVEEAKRPELEKLPNVRGGSLNGVRIHSVRLPGLIAHQEVIFGGLGQILSIRHDSTSRVSFVPGVLLAVRKVRELQGVVIGLENLMEF